MDLKPMKRDCGSAPEVGTVALFQGVLETWRTSWRRLPPYVSMGDLTVRQIARFLGAAVLTTCAMLNACSPPRTTGSAASADPCPDSEVVFAEPTATPPGLAWVPHSSTRFARKFLGDPWGSTRSTILRPLMTSKVACSPVPMMWVLTSKASFELPQHPNGAGWSF